MRMMSIASGSSGNSIYVGTDQTHVLVDAGISNRRIEKGLLDAGISPKDLSGILITHEHSDHIAGIGVLSRKYSIPIYGTKETLDYVMNSKSMGKVDPELAHPILPDCDFTLGDLTVKPFAISHDAVHPVAYRLQDDRHSVAVATDMGVYNQYTTDHLQNLDALLIESNHDVRMLESGPYPYYLKRRILGDYGHLSNENCGRLLNTILHDNIKHIFLGHLSKENNFPDLAFETVKLEITDGETPYKGSDFSISVASRDMPSEIIHL